ncbi:MAG: hypothetical protein AAGF12_29415 [Myxococcota bacterium]
MRAFKGSGRLGLLVLLLVAVVFVGCRRRAATPPPETGPAEPTAPSIATTGAGQALSRVTSDPITEEWPSLSPDGRTLLFQTVLYDQSTGQSQFSVAGVDPSTGGRRTLFTSPNASAWNPDWLPDGSSFVYVTDAMGTSAVVRALSSAPNSGVSVIVNAQSAPDPSMPSVSPDGQRVAFTTVMNSQSQVAISGLDGSNLTILGEGTSPRWHPSGAQLIFSRRVGNFDQLFSVDAATGTGLTQLTNNQANNRYPTWSPDGRYVVFTSNMAGSWDLYALRPDGTGLVQLTQGPSNATSPHWARDGFVYFSSDAAGAGWDLWRFMPVGELQLQVQAPTPAPAPAPVAEDPAAPTAP